MPNHVHLLLTPQKSGGESITMQDLGRSYVQYFNRRHKRTGTLFEGRFKSSLIESECYCLTCYRYIELNAVRAGLVTHPAEYPWSSYQANAQGRANPLITPHPLWTGLGQSMQERCRNYASLFNSESDADRHKTIRECEERSLPCGSAEFVTRVEKDSGVQVGTGDRGRPSKTY
jgi:putative transposase